MRRTKKLDLDGLWKEFLTAFLEDSIAVISPNLHQVVDWSIPPQYLEQELLNSLRGKFKIKDKRKFTDKLVKLRLKSGTDHFVLLHAEAQHEPEDGFNKRMYVYRSLIYLRYDIDDITAIAIFTGTPPDTNSLEYRHVIFGTELIYRFNSYLIAEQNEAALILSDNPFDMAVLAALYVYRTKNDAEKRFAFKRQLFLLAQKKNISREKLLKLLIFVRDFMHLPETLENEFAANDFSKILTHKEMVVYSEGTMMYIDAVLKHNTGKGLKEHQKMERAIKKLEKAEKERMEAEKNTIWNFYSKAALSQEVIAEMMGLELDYIQKVISENQKATK